MHYFSSVVRKNNQFGEVRVYWQVVHLLSNGSIIELLPGQEFTRVTGYVTFTDGSSSKTITLTPNTDGIAEQDESFELRLINATGKFAWCYFLSVYLHEIVAWLLHFNVTLYWIYQQAQKLTPLHMTGLTLVVKGLYEISQIAVYQT